MCSGRELDSTHEESAEKRGAGPSFNFLRLCVVTGRNAMAVRERKCVPSSACTSAISHLSTVFSIRSISRSDHPTTPNPSTTAATSQSCLSYSVVAVLSPLRPRRLQLSRLRLRWCPTCTTGAIPSCHTHTCILVLCADSLPSLVATCTKKCIPPTYREADLNKGESVCLDRCVSKFFEVNVKVSEKMQGEAAQAQRSGGGMGFGGM